MTLEEAWLRAEEQREAADAEARGEAHARFKARRYAHPAVTVHQPAPVNPLDAAFRRLREETRP